MPLQRKEALFRCLVCESTVGGVARCLVRRRKPRGRSPTAGAAAVALDGRGTWPRRVGADGAALCVNRQCPSRPEEEPARFAAPAKHWRLVPRTSACCESSWGQIGTLRINFKRNDNLAPRRGPRHASSMSAIRTNPPRQMASQKPRTHIPPLSSELLHPPCPLPSTSAPVSLLTSSNAALRDTVKLHRLR